MRDRARRRTAAPLPEPGARHAGPLGARGRARRRRLRRHRLPAHPGGGRGLEPAAGVGDPRRSGRRHRAGAGGPPAAPTRPRSPALPGPGAGRNARARARAGRRPLRRRGPARAPHARATPGTPLDSRPPWPPSSRTTSASASTLRRARPTGPGSTSASPAASRCARCCSTSRTTTSGTWRARWTCASPCPPTHPGWRSAGSAPENPAGLPAPARFQAGAAPTPRILGSATGARRVPGEEGSVVPVRPGRASPGHGIPPRTRRRNGSAGCASSPAASGREPLQARSRTPDAGDRAKREGDRKRILSRKTCPSRAVRASSRTGTSRQAVGKTRDESASEPPAGTLAHPGRHPATGCPGARPNRSE